MMVVLRTRSTICLAARITSAARSRLVPGTGQSAGGGTHKTLNNGDAWRKRTVHENEVSARRRPQHQSRYYLAPDSWSCPAAGLDTRRWRQCQPGPQRQQHTGAETACAEEPLVIHSMLEPGGRTDQVPEPVAVRTRNLGRLDDKRQQRRRHLGKPAARNGQRADAGRTPHRRT